MAAALHCQGSSAGDCGYSAVDVIYLQSVVLQCVMYLQWVSICMQCVLLVSAVCDVSAMCVASISAVCVSIFSMCYYMHCVLYLLFSVLVSAVCVVSICSL